ncbi:hypothetical protein MICRO80W_80114 [Micrococcus luteus]|nr:hypothetical protein MICRO80W_80114 [Micrococcus luteus]
MAGVLRWRNHTVRPPSTRPVPDGSTGYPPLTGPLPLVPVAPHLDPPTTASLPVAGKRLLVAVGLCQTRGHPPLRFGPRTAGASPGE